MKLPHDIGPHEGRELELMRRGEKHVALFFELCPLDFDGFVESGFKFIKFEQRLKSNQSYNVYIFFRSGYQDTAMRLNKIVQSTPKGIDPVREHEIGRILGYTRDQVDAYIVHASRD